MTRPPVTICPPRYAKGYQPPGWTDELDRYGSDDDTEEKKEHRFRGLRKILMGRNSGRWVI